jgi:hypothetical protein
LDADTQHTLARIYARQTALTVAAQGLQWVIGALQPGAAVSSQSLAAALNLPAIYQAQTGMLADMDCAAARLNQAFPRAR